MEKRIAAQGPVDATGAPGDQCPMSTSSRAWPGTWGTAAGAVLALGGCTTILGDFSLAEGTGAGGATSSTGAGGATSSTGAGGATSSTGAGGATSSTGAGGATSSTGAGGACTTGERQCVGSTPQRCEANGQWQDEAPCAAPLPVCNAGACVGPSCASLPPTCGPGGNESCCASAAVAGGTYHRSNDASSPATVSDFLLDRFEITVGRFRRFVDTYPTNKPAPGAGAHPLVAGSGWQAEWDLSLPMDQPGLRLGVSCNPMYPTWTNVPAGNENQPMTCLDWFEAFAFCAWDGGRLPTEAEWNRAAAGGDEQREHPWGSAAPDDAHVVYNCTADGSISVSCAATDILDVGSRSPLGDGKWGQADLSGSVWEWNLDWYVAAYENPCGDCANVTKGAALFRVHRGGGWRSGPQFMTSSVRASDLPNLRKDQFGARCARSQ